MPFGKPLKSAVHHWWPQSLSKAWADESDRVTRLTPKGETLCGPPGNFGGMKNAHAIKFSDDSPWNGSFESVFDGADNAFPVLTAWLLSLETKPAGRRKSFSDRLLSLRLEQARKRQLAECLSSLIVRSPWSRNKIRLGAQSSYHADGFMDWKPDKNLIAANMAHTHPVFRRHIAGGGKFVVMRAEKGEFICGDGFLHSFPSTPDRPLSPRCLIPLLPEITVLYFQPLHYFTYPELLTISLRKEEVDECNVIVQIYSRDYLFYRKEAPVMNHAFRGGQFLELTYHEHAGIEALMAAALNCRMSSREAGAA